MVISSKMKNSFQLVDESKIRTFQASSKLDMRNWLLEISSCINYSKDQRQVDDLEKQTQKAENETLRKFTNTFLKEQQSYIKTILEQSTLTLLSLNFDSYLQSNISDFKLSQNTRRTYKRAKEIVDVIRNNFQTHQKHGILHFFLQEVKMNGHLCEFVVNHYQNKYPNIADQMNENIENSISSFDSNSMSSSYSGMESEFAQGGIVCRESIQSRMSSKIQKMRESLSQQQQQQQQQSRFYECYDDEVDELSNQNTFVLGRFSGISLHGFKNNDGDNQNMNSGRVYGSLGGIKVPKDIFEIEKDILNLNEQDALKMLTLYIDKCIFPQYFKSEQYHQFLNERLTQMRHAITPSSFNLNIFKYNKNNTFLLPKPNTFARK